MVPQATAPEPATGRFRCVLPLRSADFAGGHVNNVRFQEFSQEARNAWFRLRMDVPDTRVPQALLRTVHIDFLSPVLDGATEVWAEVEVLAVGRSSFTMRTVIGCPDNGVDPVAVVDGVLVNTDPHGRPRELSDDERRALGAAVHHSEE